MMSAAAGVMVPLGRWMIAKYLPETDDGLAVMVSGASALMFAFAPIPWAQTTAIEMYGLQALLFGITLYSVLREWSMMAALCAGLMLANHVSSVFLLPGIALW